MSNKKGIIGKVAEGFAESTRAVHEINKENMAAVKADTKANFEAATTPDPGLVKFKQAKGVGGKVKAIAENIKEGAAANSEKERARRAEIQSHTTYKTGLEEQRTRRQATIAGTN
jgi:hypothetical protein